MPKLPGDISPTKLERVLYLLARLPIASPERKLRWLLDTEWVVDHLCRDYSRRVFRVVDHPKEEGTLSFVTRFVRPEDTVLDVGCGSGYLTSMLGRIVRSVRGMDISESAIDMARRDYAAGNVQFQVADALTLTDADLKDVDVVFLCHVLGFFDDPEGLLTMLVDNAGSVCIEVPDFDSTTLNIFRQRLGLELIFRGRDYVNEFDRDEMASLFESCHVAVRASEFRHGVQRYWCTREPRSPSSPSRTHSR